MTAPSAPYRVHGLTVQSSDVALDARRAAPLAVPDVTMELRDTGPVTGLGDPPTGEVLAYVDHDGHAQLSVTRHASSGSEVHVDFHGLARAVIDRDADHVSLHFAEDADRGLAPVLLGGTVMSVLLHLRGHAVLHASAVATDIGGRPQAVGVVGQSGMGKSTLAALLTRDGAELLADDVLRTDIDGEDVVVWPGSTAIRLRDGAASLAASDIGQARTTADGRTALSLPATHDEAVRLHALVIPRPDRSAPAVDLRRLSPLEGFGLVSRFPRILGWTDAQLSGALHRHVGAVVNRVPVYVATVPWGPPFAPGVGAAVLRALVD